MPSRRKAAVLALITARGGSKGLPRKNILPLAGRPVIAYSIAAALGAQTLDGPPIVSTDDPEIAAVARHWGALAPFLRPPELAGDDTTIYPVMIHAIQWLAQYQSYTPDYVMLLQPTSPLRTSEDIDGAVTLALDKNADGVVSVCEPKHHPYLAKLVSEEGKLSNLMSLDRAYHRRQDLPPAYTLNGAIYVARRDVLLERQTFYTDRTYAYIMPADRSLDIDTTWDLFLAEQVLKGEARLEGS